MVDRNSPLRILEHWVEKHSQPDDKRYFINGEYLSARDLLKEVENGTPTGLDYIESIILLARSDGDHCRHTLFQ